MQRKNISSGGKWEDIVGYSRAVKIGDIVFVAGTTAHSIDEVIGKDDAYAQSVYILKKIEKALKEAGATLEDVIQTRIYVVDVLKNGDLVGKAHGEFFKNIKPVCTMVGVNSLVDPNLLVEIEIIAITNLTSN
jgi:enamine deaminase RidA (YjgF/YER057c/UK114 family)